MTRVIIRTIDFTGLQEVWTDLPDVEVFSINEHIPRDRVYRLGPSVRRVTPAEIDALLGNSRVGELGDMPGAEAAVGRLLDGEPEPPKGAHLRAVDDE